MTIRSRFWFPKYKSATDRNWKVPSSRSYGGTYLPSISIVVTLAVLIILVSSWSLQSIVQGTLLRDAEQKAMHWAKSFVNQIPDLNRLAETGHATPSQRERIKATIAAGDIFRFKLFLPNGQLSFVSDSLVLQDEVQLQSKGVDTHSGKAIEVYATQTNDVSVRDGKSDPDRPDTYVEAYLPVKLHSGEVFGVIEVYVDVSSLAVTLTDTFRWFSTLLILGSTMIFLVPSFILIFRNKQVEVAQTREGWFAAILDNAPFEVVIKDIEGKIKAISRNVAKELDLDPMNFVGKTTADFLPEEIAKKYMDADMKVVRTGNSSQFEVIENLGDRIRYSLSSKFPLVDSVGRTTGICSITNDITEIKQAEAKLVQAQKMEAVGQLTGGVAHDFNNLLAIIMWSAEALEMKFGADDIHLKSIIQNTERGAELTQRLLSFSRQQALKPQAIDTKELVLGLSEMLERTLGETIEIATNFDPNLGHVIADPNQLENALLNLALNARDAMPKGGKLIVTCSMKKNDNTANSESCSPECDECVVLSVCDDGSGMSADTLAHAFEPFFTTKEVGMGSGLGLSMVFGFAEQSGGQVIIESQLGAGTTVNLFLPSGRKESSLRIGTSIEAPRAKKKKKKMKVLLVEDDLEVRSLVHQLLENLDHDVLSYQDAVTARNVLANRQHFDLLISDVVLPGGVSGPDFAKELAVHLPLLKVVFMSGYPQSSLANAEIQIEESVLLNKPFRRKELADVLEEIFL